MRVGLRAFRYPRSSRISPTVGTNRQAPPVGTSSSANRFGGTFGQSVKALEALHKASKAAEPGSEALSPGGDARAVMGKAKTPRSVLPSWAVVTSFRLSIRPPTARKYRGPSGVACTLRLPRPKCRSNQRGTLRRPLYPTSHPRGAYNRSFEPRAENRLWSRKLLFPFLIT